MGLCVCVYYFYFLELFFSQGKDKGQTSRTHAHYRTCQECSSTRKTGKRSIAGGRGEHVPNKIPQTGGGGAATTDDRAHGPYSKAAKNCKRGIMPKTYARVKMTEDDTLSRVRSALSSPHQQRHNCRWHRRRAAQHLPFRRPRLPRRPCSALKQYPNTEKKYKAPKNEAQTRVKQKGLDGCTRNFLHRKLARRKIRMPFSK